MLVLSALTFYPGSVTAMKLAIAPETSLFSARPCTHCHASQVEQLFRRWHAPNSGWWKHPACVSKQQPRIIQHSCRQRWLFSKDRTKDCTRLEERAQRRRVKIIGMEQISPQLDVLITNRRECAIHVSDPWLAFRRAKRGKLLSVQPESFTLLPSEVLPIPDPRRSLAMSPVRRRWHEHRACPCFIDHRAQCFKSLEPILSSFKHGGLL
mmetsp:Transcript_79949/g.222763  ORF Transcript_79949/g.222763 Transcript_79949/m.222763 type:complete len:209 (+) Transcript_79949:320-946(+)